MRARYVLWALGIAASVVLGACGSSASSPASTSSSVNPLLISAAKTESAANLQYYAYADGAGQPALADVWRTIGQVEHQDHWTHEVTTAALYSSSDNVANLQLAIKQAQQAAAADQTWAAQAPQGSEAATVLMTVAGRETAAASLLTQALNVIQGQGGSLPAAPAVQQVQVNVSPQPKYSGAFLNSLTSGSDSSLETAAWNWAEYQFDAKTAVDTKQANLAQLLSGLEAQEVQNWTEVSNVAGYVNTNAMNLQASIDSEQGAITMYGQFATQAQQAGNSSLASTFRSIRGDEQGHHDTFSTELQQLKGGA